MSELKKINILTYRMPHRKTYDTVCLLKARGYKNVTLYALPLKYAKSFQPLIEHRPALNMEMGSPMSFCENFGYQYIEKNSYEEITCEDREIFLICGAGLLPKKLTEKNICINSHPGYIPNVRGLDALKWAILENEPIGVTSHIIGNLVDLGTVIERKLVPIYKMDTFHALAQRVYEMEINLLVNAVEQFENPIGDFLDNSHIVHRRMSKDKETKLFEQFEKRKRTADWLESVKN